MSKYDTELAFVVSEWSKLPRFVRDAILVLVKYPSREYRKPKVTVSAVKVVPGGPDDLATIREACAFLRIGRTLLWKLRSSNSLTTVCVGDRILFRWSDLRAAATSGLGKASQQTRRRRSAA